MITGFNTDIEYDGVTYHIQTEDKGTSTPFILSLVYNRGAILASKRTPYDDLIADGLDENILTDRLQKQHKIICAAVRKGRIEELKRMSEKRESQHVFASKKTNKIPVSEDVLSIIETALPVVSNNIGLSDDLINMPSSNGNVSDQIYVDEPVIEDASIFEDDVILPVEAVAIVSDLAGTERPENSRLSLEFIGESRFKGGQSKSLTLMLCRGNHRKVVSDAEIMIKIMGSSFRPVIFHSKTDGNGIARIDIKIPSFREGRATIVVRAISSGEEIEIRRLVTHDES